MSLADRLARVRETIAAAGERTGRDPASVRIVAITKGQPAQTVVAALGAGLRDIGENRVHEAVAKFGEIVETLAGSGVRRHMVGHLQRNKVRDALQIFDWVQSIDSLRLARALSERMAGRAERLEALVEVKAAGEERKYGFDPEEAVERALEVGELEGLRLRGVMTMAPWTAEERELRRTFRRARWVFEELRGVSGSEAVDTLSMGMTNDFGLAVEEGSTMVRLGTALFGPRSG